MIRHQGPSKISERTDVKVEASYQRNSKGFAFYKGSRKYWKSTARMARIVMSIIWARYVVNAGRGGILTRLLDVEADETKGWRKGRGTPPLGLGK